jgi:hypothetical protein
VVSLIIVVPFKAEMIESLSAVLRQMTVEGAEGFHGQRKKIFTKMWCVVIRFSIVNLNSPYY